VILKSIFEKTARKFKKRGWRRGKSNRRSDYDQNI
jgi:hypothetical protein